MHEVFRAYRAYNLLYGMYSLEVFKAYEKFHCRVGAWLLYVAVGFIRGLFIVTPSGSICLLGSKRFEF